MKVVLKALRVFQQFESVAFSDFRRNPKRLAYVFAYTWSISILLVQEGGFKPEEKRDPHLNGALRGSRGLRAIEDLLANADTGTAAGASIRLRNVREALVRVLLTDVGIPAETLVRANKELVVEVVHLLIVLVKRVTVDRELHLLAKALSDEVDVCQKLSAVGRIRSGIRPVGSILCVNRTEDNMEYHVIEEISKLRDRELNIAVQTSRA